MICAIAREKYWKAINLFFARFTWYVVPDLPSTWPQNLIQSSNCFHVFIAKNCCQRRPLFPDLRFGCLWKQMQNLNFQTFLKSTSIWSNNVKSLKPYENKCGNWMCQHGFRINLCSNTFDWPQSNYAWIQWIFWLHYIHFKRFNKTEMSTLLKKRA